MASAISFANQNLGIFQYKAPAIRQALDRIDMSTRTHVGKYVVLDLQGDPQLYDKQFGHFKKIYFCASRALGSDQYTIQLALRSRLHCPEFQKEKRVFTLLKGVKGVVQPLLIQELGAFEYLITELCNQGDLFSFVKKPNLNLNSINVRLIGYLIVCALRECHARGVIHRDIKLDNIVVHQKDDGSFEIRLIDFGFAFLMNEDSETESKRCCGSQRYFSPGDWNAIYKTGTLPPLGYSRDLWPLGAVLFVSATGALPNYSIERNGVIIGTGMHPLNSFSTFGIFESVIKDIIYQDLQYRPSLSSIQERMYTILKRGYGDLPAINDLVKPDATSSSQPPLANWAVEKALEKFLNVVGSTEAKTSGGTIFDIIHSYLVLGSSKVDPQTA
jgi:serine/threonine protein kinase